jgi:hypothetical protein
MVSQSWWLSLKSTALPDESDVKEASAGIEELHVKGTMETSPADEEEDSDIVDTHISENTLFSPAEARAMVCFASRPLHKSLV